MRWIYGRTKNAWTPFSNELQFVEIESVLKNDRDTRKKIECGIPRNGCGMPNHRVLKTATNEVPVCGFWKAEGPRKANLWNFAVLAPSCLSDEATVEIAKHETKVAMTLPSHKRGRAAGGPMEAHPVCDDMLNSKWCSKGTQIDRKHEHKGQSVNPRTKHRGVKSGQPVTWQPKLEMPGSQRTPAAVRKRLVHCKFYREQTLKLQQSRFTCQLVASHHKVGDNKEHPETLDNGNKQGLWQHLNDVTKAFTNNWHEEWANVDPSLSKWQAFLLEHSLQTGETINQGQMCAHADRSKGRLIETMMLISKCGLEDKRDHSTTAKELEAKVGQLAFSLPQHGCHLRPGKDALHADFTSTVHFPTTAEELLIIPKQTEP